MYVYICVCVYIYIYIYIYNDVPLRLYSCIKYLFYTKAKIHNLRWQRPHTFLSVCVHNGPSSIRLQESIKVMDIMYTYMHQSTCEVSISHTKIQRNSIANYSDGFGVCRKQHSVPSVWYVAKSQVLAQTAKCAHLVHKTRTSACQAHAYCDVEHACMHACAISF
jgi:hypothetical protein